MCTHYEDHDTRCGSARSTQSDGAPASHPLLIRISSASYPVLIRIYSRLDVGVQHLRNYNHPLLIRISSVLHPLSSASQVEVHLIRFSSASHPLLAYYESHTKCVLTMKIMILDVGVHDLPSLMVRLLLIRFLSASHPHLIRFSSVSILD